MAIEFFEPMIPPATTHNDLVAVAGPRGKARLVKSAALKEAESIWEAHLAKHAPQKPLDGPVALELRICWPTCGRHGQGEWHDVKPDADNIEKTVFDVMAKLGYFANDSRLALHTTAKLWSDPAGLYVRMEEI